MLFKRAIAGAATICVAATTTVLAAGAAQAVSGPTPTELAQTAAVAAAAADQAFIDAKWDEVSAQADAFDVAYGALLTLRSAAADAVDDAQSTLAAAQQALANAQSAAASAASAVDDAQDDSDDAAAAFNVSIASVLGAPAWWTELNTRPVKVSDLPAAIDSANEALATAQANMDTAQAAYDSAVGITARIIALVELTYARLDRDAAQARVNVLNQAFAAVDGPQRQQAVADAAAALSAAQGAKATADDAVANAEGAVVAAEAALTARQGALSDIDALIAGLADAAQSVADRRADLVDLDTVKRTVVWTLGANNRTPRAGDAIKLNFTIPNSQLFALSNAQVKVTAPKGIVPGCDIIGGVVDAGATVHCTATYIATDADAKVGKVIFEVQLTGLIPLGPGNPRGAAATQTLITASTAITVPVAARVAQASGDELAATGLDTVQLAALAGGLVLAGALLIARREKVLPRL